jgi:hypothetical protein
MMCTTEKVSLLKDVKQPTQEGLMEKSLKATLAAALAVGVSAGAVAAGPLMDRIDAGQSIRIGFANEMPFAYPGEDGEPRGFVNAHTLGVLEAMGYTNIEPVQTDWGGLIPGLHANRFDIITGGMNILAARCENIAFSEPIARIGDGFIVQAGNPKGIGNYDDVRESGAIMVTGAGYSNIPAAREAAGLRTPTSCRFRDRPRSSPPCAPVVPTPGRAPTSPSASLPTARTANSRSPIPTRCPRSRSTGPASASGKAGSGFRRRLQCGTGGVSRLGRDARRGLRIRLWRRHAARRQ